ncbi:HAT, C-terminal dimerization domain [Fusarium oxysporum f. sp. vasinfectum]|nr:HAT, C-terminal dimerization domain [Fusarium oxysporum f. sp. vasinfectum]
MEVLKEYDLISHNKIGYVVLNNASNNGRAIKELGRKLQWRDPARRRIHCFGHILHLVARAMLFVNDGNALEDLDPEEFDEWTKADPLHETPVEYVATVLHPGIQWSFLTKAYGEREGWIDKARHPIQTLSEEEYRDLPAQWEIGDSNLPVAMRAREYNPFDIIPRRAYVVSEPEEESVADEFERWQSTKQDIFSKHDNPLEYWYAKRFEYPRVAKMAIDVLSVPAMATECERAFSSAGSMVSPQRTRLDASTIAVIQTFRSCLKAGLLEGYDGLLKETSGEVAG